MPREIFRGHHPPDRKETVFGSGTAWIYPGQGTQFVGMGEDLFQKSRFVRNCYGTVDGLLNLDPSITEVSFNGPEETLNQTLYAQLAIFVFNHICESLLTKLCVVSSNRKMVSGHSLGEYNALVAAGALSFKDALLLVGERAKAMTKACQKNPGGMIAVPLRETDERLNAMKGLGMEISVVNSHEQTVLSGTLENIDRAIRWMREEGIKGSRLKVEGGFHSSLMQPAVKDFSEALAQVNIKPAQIPIVGNTTAILIQSPEEIREELINQLTHPVLWKNSLVLMTRNGIGQTIEIGEKGILSSMNLKVNGGKIERLRALLAGGVAISFVRWQRQIPAMQPV